MAPAKNPGAFPILSAVLRLTGKSEPHAGKKSKVENEHVDVSHVYDVKFYPYLLPDDEVVFAVVFIRSVYVFRLTQDAKDFVEVLAVFRDPKHHEYYDPKHDASKGADRHIKAPLLADFSLNSIVWSQDVATGDPLICFGGSNSGDIRMVNVVKKQFLRNLSGHGGAINDLTISPLSPAILASASNDFSIRLWNLDPAYQHQPCAAILASPDAHKQAVLTTSFHGKGKYLLSAGHDTMINLWPVPKVPDMNAGTDRTTTVHFPLFSSTEVHSNYVDCVRFHGDLIMSHAASAGVADNKPNSILLWKIDGFSSADPVPDLPPTAKPGLYTRSAFGGRFQRLLTFDMPNTGTIYMRFGLFNAPDMHPILAMGNEKSKFSFWDLQALEERSQSAATPAPIVAPAADEDSGSEGTTTPSVLPTPTRATPTRGRGGRPRGSGRGRGGGSTGPRNRGARYDMSDPFRPVPPHHQVTVPKYNFAVRQMAWSNCGSWCVGTGQLGIVAVFRRWGGARGVERRDDEAGAAVVEMDIDEPVQIEAEAMEIDP